MSNIHTISVFISIIIGNLFSAYFRIRFYKESFNKNIKLKDILLYGITSAISALWIIRLFSFTNMLSKVVSEEFAKWSISELSKNHQVYTDHIITAILAWVSFAIIENCLYFFYLNPDIALQVSFVRILSNSIVHALFTGCIGYGIAVAISPTNWYKKYINAILFVIVWIMAHYSYNRLLLESYVAFAFIFVILWYFWLSFLLYKSDRLYLQ